MALGDNYIITDADDFDLEDADTYFPFDDLIAAFQPKSPQLEIIVRPGVDGESMRHTGYRAEPTTMRTLLYVDTRANAQAAIEAYLELFDGNPYEIVAHGQSWGFFRLSAPVHPQPIIPCASAAGTISANPNFLLMVDWQVLSTQEPA